MPLTAHDVRALRICRGCQKLGDGRDMLRQIRGQSTRHFHGRCYLATYGIKNLIAHAGR